VVDGSGNPDADALEVGGVDASLRQQRASCVDHLIEDEMRAAGDAEVEMPLGQDVHGEVGDGHADVLGPDVDGEHSARVGAEVERSGRASHGRGAFADLTDQARVRQRIQPGCDGRSGLARDRDQLSASARFGTKKLEDLTHPGCPGEQALELFHAEK
jgi:hypothetical protein